jgi:FkbM family methyltransferase
VKSKKFQKVIDKELGELFFPSGDNVMAPFIASNGFWEESEIDWLKENVHVGFRCLNIGANVGYFTIWLSKLSGKSGEVIAFEPNPILIPFLKKNIKKSKLENIRIFRAAVGDRNGFQWLFLNNKNFGDSRMFDPRITIGGGSYTQHGFKEKPKKRLVRILKVDRVINGKVDIVLIDTQGYDHYVLRGMKTIIKRNKPKVLTEFVPQWIIDLGDDPIEILNEYMSWGYSIGSTDFEIPPNATAADIIDKIEKSGRYFTNLILT